MRRYSRGNLGLLILCKPVPASQFFPLSLHFVPELSVWLKNTFKPRRVEYELPRSASTKFPAVRYLNNESLCINIDEGKSCSSNFATIYDCLQVQKVNYCTKEATRQSTLSFLANMPLSLFMYAKVTLLSIYLISWTVLKNKTKEHFVDNILLTTAYINIQGILIFTWFYSSCDYKVLQLFTNKWTTFCALLGLRTTHVMMDE